MRVERTLVGLLFIAMAAAPGCGRLAYNLPPAQRILEPGPGVDGPGPGVIPPAGSPYGMNGGGVGRFGGGMGGYMGGAGGGACGCYGGGPNAVPSPSPNGNVMPAGYNGPVGGFEQGGPGGCNGSCACGPNGGCAADNRMNDPQIQQAGFHPFGGGNCGCMRPGSTEAYADGSGGAGGMSTSQIAFLGDDGVQVSWDVSGSGTFDSSPLVIPARQDFYQGAIYRLKLSNIPGRAGVTLYPTLEIAPVTPRTDAYLAHSPIPVQFTQEDFDQVTSGNFVTKVIYLPDPEFQELALAGVETLVSTRLDPGVDPIAEADRRGSILAIVRIGNKNLELNNGVSMGSDNVVPAGNEAPAGALNQANQAMYNQSAGGPAEPGNFNAQQAQYCGGGCGPYGCQGGGAQYGYGGGCYGDGSMANMPMGMPTGGFAPQPVPPNMIAGGPQWGMPMTGTPIGLPGPPHIPLGSPAGLRQHVIRNRTRIDIPPPVAKVEMSVKQRPGLNYPRPVDHVTVDETQREPIHLLPTWLTDSFHRGGSGNGGQGGGSAYCGPCPQ
ncbi:MAG TPA: hypothetical protein VH107_14540 [Lacipirellulaceae bacterium]|nr:hypothetical protein [Lacipirellulaceae bacterium]